MGDSNKWYPSSANAPMAYDRVDELFPEMDGDGSVSGAWAGEVSGLDRRGQVDLKNALKAEFERRGVCYSDRHLRRIIAGWDFLAEWREMPGTVTTSMCAAVDRHLVERNQSWESTARNARSRRWTIP